MQRIVAGGTGFIGKHLVNHWLAGRYDVTVIGRSHTDIQRAFAGRVKSITWQELAANGNEILDNTEIIVNLAGSNIGSRPWSKKRKRELIASRIQPTKFLADLCATQGSEAPALFNASGVGIYGHQTFSNSIVCDEDTVVDIPPLPTFLAKLGNAWEDATASAKTAGCRVINMRFGVVLARDGGVLPRLSLPFYFFLGGTYGRGNQPFAWIGLSDLIRAIDFLISKPTINGPVNFVAPDSISQAHLIQTLSETLHRPAPWNYPSWLIRKLLGQMGEELLLQGQIVKPERLLTNGFEFIQPDISTALTEIYR